MSPTTNPPGLRSEAEIQERLRLLLTQLPQRTDDEEDRECAYLAALIFALGTDWTDARLEALELWNARLKRIPPPPDPQCALCGSWNVDEDEHDAPGRYYRCRACGQTWVVYAVEPEDFHLFGRDLWQDHAPADVPVG